MTCLPSKSPSSRTSSARLWTGASQAISSELPKGETKDDTIVCKVSHTGGRPILFLPDRKTHPNIPKGWTDVLVDGDRYEANFVKVAVNVMRKKGEKQNRLADVMRAWFGPKAGLPGTNSHVTFRRQKGVRVLEPLHRK